ncbi:MAG: UvrD-helicase domain-containing protein [Candidatus Coprenecus sp.]
MLKIYNASAGSGKTYTLTQEYLKMLFSRVDDVDHYKSVLAVTFTNKATDEMKQRILGELFRLSEGKSPHMQTLMQIPELVEEFREGALRSSFIKKRARKLLVRILNDYSYFNVSTIDSFFQQITRAFAREIGFYSSYTTEIETDAAIESAIGALMESLDNEPKLLRKLLDISFGRIEEGKGYDVIPALVDLSKELFKEEFKVKVNGREAQIFAQGKIDAYISNVNKKWDELRTHIADIGKDVCRQMALEELTPDLFRGKSKSGFGIFVSLAHGELLLPSKTMLATIEKDASEWLAKGVRSFVSPELEQKVRQAVEQLPALSRDYNTLSALKTNVNTLVLLATLRRLIEAYCKENNLILLSDTTQFLKNIIDGSETPFIYERVGTRIENYLLDEFQDTSAMQWCNFKPLIDESVGYSDSLIVGDVKQSIYRFRGSDYTLMKDELAKDYPDADLIRLENNYRSNETIVKFNNGFFSSLGNIPDSDISQIYTREQVCQKLPDGRARGEGSVEINFIPHCIQKALSANRAAAWIDIIGGSLLGRIKEFRDMGYDMSDMAILVRTNAEGGIVSDFLLRNGISIVTDDSLLVGSAASVRRVVATLSSMDNPSDNIVRYMHNGEYPKITESSLYGICEEIIESLDEELREEVPFLQAFMDNVNTYMSKNGSDIRGFLEWWKGKADSISISIPTGKNTIRVITVHKSKGLEFPVVFIPFLKDPFRSPSRIRWVNVSEFNAKNAMGDLEIVPIKMNKNLENSEFASIYQEERQKEMLDSLNVWYVGFTRPCDHLAIWAFPDNDPEGNPCSCVANMLYAYCKSDPETVFRSAPPEEIPSGTERILSGKRARCSAGDKAPVQNNTITPFDTYERTPIGDRLELAFKGDEFYASSNEAGPGNSRLRGVALHAIFESIATSDDVDDAIRKAVNDGIIRQKDVRDTRITVMERIRSVQERGWFSDHVQLLNETPILTPEGDDYRPDRVIIYPDNKVVVVDYKFGRKKLPEYQRQVENYVLLIKEMGYENVEGYIWYSDGPVQISTSTI